MNIEDINFPKNVLWRGPTITLRSPNIEKDCLSIKILLSDIYTITMINKRCKKKIGKTNK
jgi:hypothetical protein